MNNISLAFTILAAMSGFFLLGLAIDASLYTYGPPKDQKRWLIILVVATLFFTFIAILTNGKGCEDYTQFDYKYGEVPISCEAKK